MALSFTILPREFEYAFVWTPHAPATTWHGALRTRTAAHRLAHVRLEPQQQLDLQAALDGAAQIANHLQSATSTSSSNGETSAHPLKRLGRLLFSQLIPPDLQEQIRGLPPATPVVINTNDTILPWELLHDDHDFLALRHAVGRAIMAEESCRESPRREQERISCLLIGNPTDDLEAADQEIELLLDVLDASSHRPQVEFLCREQASKVQVLSALASGDYDIIHFACHARPGALRLADDWLHTTEIRAALRGSPIVYLNACNSARELTADKSDLPFAGHHARNLAFAFLSGGACAFIGSIWPVSDDRVQGLALEFYRLFLSGQTMGEALRRARLLHFAETAGEITWAAPVLYGDPLNRLIPQGGFRQLGTVLDMRLSFAPAAWQNGHSDHQIEQRQSEMVQIVNEIARHGGEIFTATTERLCAVFGVPHPFEDDAVRAVGAALAVQQQTETWPSGQPSIAIASGEIVLKSIASQTLFLESETSELPLCLGPAVTEVQLLRSQVRPGQILATERTRELTDSRFRFVSVTDTPIVAHEVSATMATGDARTPQTDLKKNRSKLFGRTDELAILTTNWAIARRGGGQVLGIMGEAGVGKTRLLREFRKSLKPDEFTWLSGSCPATDQETPYALIGQLLRTMFDISTSDSEAQAQAKFEQQLADQQEGNGAVDPQLIQILNETLGLSHSELPIDERKARRGRLVHLLRTLMARSARQQPLLITIDDMQWVDEASLEILEQVTDGINRLPVQIIFVYRPEWQHPWNQKSYYRHLPVDHLADAPRIDLLCSLLETDELPPGLAPLLEKTAGNPFFIEEMVKSLQDTGMLRRLAASDGQADTGQWELRQPLTDAHLPGTIQRTVLVRMSRLAPETQHVLQAAAVVGPLVAPALLQNVLGQLDRPLDQHLAELEDRNFLQARWDVGDYQFRHALIRDAAYQSLPTGQRQVLHRRSAEALERSTDPGQAETLAHHYYHSLLISQPDSAHRLDDTVNREQIRRAQTYLVQSGTRAQERYAASEALNYYGRALAVAGLHGGDEDAEIEIHEGLGDAHNILGDFDAADKALRQAYAMLHTRPLTGDDRRHAADLARRIGRLCTWTGEHDTALHWMAEGLRQLGEIEEDEGKATAALIYIHFASVHINQGDFEQATKQCLTGLKLAGESARSDVQAEGNHLLGVIHWSQGMNDEAIEFLLHSRQLWRNLGNAYQVARVEENIGIVHFRRSDWENARNYHAQGLIYWEQIEDRDMLACACLNTGNIHLYQGDWAQAQRQFERALALWENAQNKRWIGLCHNNLGLLYIEQEDWNQAQTHLQYSRELFEKLNIADLLVETHYALAEVALGLNQIELAIQLANQALQSAQKLSMQLELALSQRILGRALALHGSPADGHEQLRSSLALLKDLNAHYEVGRTEYHLAQLNAAGVHTPESRELLQHAMEVFQSLGAQNDLDKTQYAINSS